MISQFQSIQSISVKQAAETTINLNPIWLTYIVDHQFRFGIVCQKIWKTKDPIDYLKIL